MTMVDAFYRHLDRCKKCREHPFNLCGIGSLLLEATAGTVTSEISRPMTETERDREGRSLSEIEPHPSSLLTSLIK